MEEMKTIAKKRVGRPATANRPTDDELLNLYQYFTAPQIASKYGVKPSTVRNWVLRIKKKRGI